MLAFSERLSSESNHHFTQMYQVFLYLLKRAISERERHSIRVKRSDYWQLHHRGRCLPSSSCSPVPRFCASLGHGFGSISAALADCACSASG